MAFEAEDLFPRIGSLVRLDKAALLDIDCGRRLRRVTLIGEESLSETAWGS